MSDVLLGPADEPQHSGALSDPQLAREIARLAVRYAAAVHGSAFVVPAISEHPVMEEILAGGDKGAYGRLRDAARIEVPAAFAEVWPDEPKAARDNNDFVSDVVWLVERNEVLRDQRDKLAAMLGRLVDIDHNGYCQAHNLSRPCDIAAGRELLARVRAEFERLASADE